MREVRHDGSAVGNFADYDKRHMDKSGIIIVAVFALVILLLSGRGRAIEPPAGTIKHSHESPSRASSFVFASAGNAAAS